MENKELSKAELKRKESFEKLSEELKKQGYTQKVLTISIASANIFAILLFGLAAIIFGAWYWFVSGNIFQQFLEDSNIIELIFFLIGLIGSVVLHELVHGMTWGIFCKKHFQSIRFGVMKQYLTPYCNCSEPLKRNQYFLGAIMPLIVVGIIPSIIGIYISNVFLFIIGVIMISGASGDLMCVYKLMTYKENGECIYYDHPYEAGLVVFEK